LFFIRFPYPLSTKMLNRLQFLLKCLLDPLQVRLKTGTITLFAHPTLPAWLLRCFWLPTLVGPFWLAGFMRLLCFQRIFRLLRFRRRINVSELRRLLLLFLYLPCAKFTYILRKLNHTHKNQFTFIHMERIKAIILWWLLMRSQLLSL